MPEILQTKSIYYNDVNLIAQPATVHSRSQIPQELSRIFISPMASVIGKTFALEANKLGLGLLLHRFCSPQEEAELYSMLPNKENVFCSIGLSEWERVNVLTQAGCTNWLIDIANGYISTIKEAVKTLNEVAEVKKIMCGNVHTLLGYDMLFKNMYVSEDTEYYLRVGIAGGSACATSDSTGVNRGQVTELSECFNYRNFATTRPEYNNPSSYVCADGGIKNGNYAAKAFAAGADYLLMGGYFVHAEEAETHITGDSTYWGGASYKQAQLYSPVTRKHSEGKVLEIKKNKIKPLKVLVNELWGGISSAVSYCGHSTVLDLVGNGVFEIKQNSLPPNKG